jgi:hypothetical protein
VALPVGLCHSLLYHHATPTHHKTIQQTYAVNHKVKSHGNLAGNRRLYSAAVVRRCDCQMRGYGHHICTNSGIGNGRSLVLRWTTPETVGANVLPARSSLGPTRPPLPFLLSNLEKRMGIVVQYNPIDRRLLLPLTADESNDSGSTGSNSRVESYVFLTTTIPLEARW